MARFSCLAVLLLAGCASQPVYLRACPVAPKYTQAFEVKAAGELALLPQGSAIEQMLSDYGAVRREIADCH
jgi:uncharacterized lipoprotein YajG